MKSVNYTVRMSTLEERSLWQLNEMVMKTRAKEKRQKLE